MACSRFADSANWSCRSATRRGGISAAERRPNKARGGSPWFGSAPRAQPRRGDRWVVDDLTSRRPNRASCVRCLISSIMVLATESETTDDNTMIYEIKQRTHRARFGRRGVWLSTTHRSPLRGCARGAEANQGLPPLALFGRRSAAEMLPRLVAERHAQFAESAKREQAITANLRGLGYGG